MPGGNWSERWEIDLCADGSARDPSYRFFGADISVREESPVRMTAGTVQVVAKAASQATRARKPGTLKVIRVRGTTMRRRLAAVPPTRSTFRAGQTGW